jgi:hypothetical protein
MQVTVLRAMDVAPGGDVASQSAKLLNGQRPLSAVVKKRAKAKLVILTSQPRNRMQTILMLLGPVPVLGEGCIQSLERRLRSGSSHAAYAMFLRLPLHNELKLPRQSRYLLSARKNETNLNSLSEHRHSSPRSEEVYQSLAQALLLSGPRK